MEKIILSEISTRAPKDLDKKEIKEKLKTILAELDDLQNLLFAENKHSVLVDHTRVWMEAGKME
jgi:hypothetical protein